MMAHIKWAQWSQLCSSQAHPHIAQASVATQANKCIWELRNGRRKRPENSLHPSLNKLANESSLSSGVVALPASTAAAGTRGQASLAWALWGDSESETQRAETDRILHWMQVELEFIFNSFFKYIEPATKGMKKSAHCFSVLSKKKLFCFGFFLNSQRKSSDYFLSNHRVWLITCIFNQERLWTKTWSSSELEPYKYLS